MKIEKIKKLKSGKYKITLDNEEDIITYDDVIIENNLLYNKELTSDVLNKINIDNEYYEVYNKVIKFITTRVRSKKEVLDYLNKNEYTQDLIDPLINKLDEIGLINDYNFAKAYTSDKLHLSNWGPLKIKEGLVSNEIKPEIIEEVLEGIDKEYLKDKLNKIILKQVNNNKKHSSYQLQQKIVLDLVNKGYSRDMILELISNIDINDNEQLDKEYNKLYNRLSKKYSKEKLFYQIQQKLYQKGFDINEIHKYMNEKIEE